jgi:hypothetical protein
VAHLDEIVRQKDPALKEVVEQLSPELVMANEEVVAVRVVEQEFPCEPENCGSDD